MVDVSFTNSNTVIVVLMYESGILTMVNVSVTKSTDYIYIVPFCIEQYSYFIN